MEHADHVRLLRGGVPAPGGVWADFGAGRGAFTLALAELIGPGSALHAIDRDANALRELARLAAERFPDVALHTQAADFTRPLPAPLPALDGLIMANALHFVPPRDQARVVQLLKGTLKPGGRWLMVEYNVDKCQGPTHREQL